MSEKISKENKTNLMCLACEIALEPVETVLTEEDNLVFVDLISILASK